MGCLCVLLVACFETFAAWQTRRGSGSQEGSVATLQSSGDRLAGCSSWHLRFVVYSSGGNLSRRSSCWRWDGTCAFPCRCATSKSCSPSGICTPTTSRCGSEKRNHIRRRSFGSSNNKRIFCAPDSSARQPRLTPCLNTDSMGCCGSSDESSTEAASSRFSHSSTFRLVELVLPVWALTTAKLPTMSVSPIRAILHVISREFSGYLLRGCSSRRRPEIVL